MELSISSPAKINLHLKVFEKNADGYHRVETSMVKTTLADDIDLTIKDGEGIAISVDAPFSQLSTPDNLAYRAADLFLKKTGFKKSVSIHIKKRIPLGAGLGGGSSNAGTVLEALNRALGHPLKLDELMFLGKQLGADVPFFVQSDDFALLKGRGDELVESFEFPSLSLLIVYPNIHCSTPKVYQSLGRSLTWTGTGGISGPCKRQIIGWKDIDFLLEFGNDLQQVTEKMHPVIGQIREELKQHGAYFSQMSGSGASVVGLFGSDEAALKAASHFEKDYPCFPVQTGTHVE
ncbi:MAG: 4-(cytidine 5'-diphospho)-2-C-methyl-D-erythritol kinase [Proteobacteria bacterium]|nr:4-(cytidine 5'-diphospho)-2-C-methyl-D-erythritol kinase [Pseudomonadota bacterium]